LKKIIAVLALLCAPILVYFGVFLCFEPYDYFGLKGGAVQEDSYITRVRSYLNSPQDAILLGDSRMAHFDMAEVERLTGRPWANLAFGGASMAESIDLFYLAAEENPSLDTCYFEVSFYTLRTGDERNRMEHIRTLVENPLAYLFNFDCNADMLNELLLRLQGVQTGASRDEGHWTQADLVSETGEALPYRKNQIAYLATLYGAGGIAKAGTLPAVETDEAGSVQNAGEVLATLQDVTPQASAYSVNEENLQALVELAGFCRQRGIELTFVFPPVDGAVQEYLLDALGIRSELVRVKETLAATGAQIRDFECQPEATFKNDMFYDGFHLDAVRGLGAYTEVLFEQNDAKEGGAVLGA
jgi:hypothetical protein